MLFKLSLLFNIILGVVIYYFMEPTTQFRAFLDTMQSRGTQIRANVSGKATAETVPQEKQGSKSIVKQTLDQISKSFESMRERSHSSSESTESGKLE